MSRIVRFFTHPPLAIAVGPFQFVLMIIAIIQGATLLINAGRPVQGILTATYPAWMVIIWGLALLGGAVTAIVGRIKIRGWRQEAAGLCVIGFGLVWYVVTVAALHPDHLLVNLPDLGYAYACYVRIRVLRMAHEAEMEARDQNG